MIALVHSRHQEADRLARRFARFARLGQPPGVNDRDAVADLEEFVEILADDQHRDAPRAVRSSRAWRIAAEASASTPQVGWLTTKRPGSLRISRPTTNFCKFPPDSVRASGSAPDLRTSKAATTSFALSSALRGVDEAGARHARGAVRGQHDIFRQREIGRRGVAVALFGHERRAERAPARDADVADRLAVDADRLGPARDQLAREIGEEFGLAVAGDAGDADHFAAAHGERDIFQRNAVQRGRGRAERGDDEARLAQPCAPASGEPP